MKLVTSAAVVAGVIACAAVGFASAADAAPAGPRSVDQTISELQLQGFHVIVDKVGTHLLDQCAVDSQYVPARHSSGGIPAHRGQQTTSLPP